MRRTPPRLRIEATRVDPAEVAAITAALGAVMASVPSAPAPAEPAWARAARLEAVTGRRIATREDLVALDRAWGR